MVSLEALWAILVTLADIAKASPRAARGIPGAKARREGVSSPNTLVWSGSATDVKCVAASHSLSGKPLRSCVTDPTAA